MVTILHIEPQNGSHTAATVPSCVAFSEAGSASSHRELAYFFCYRLVSKLSSDVLILNMYAFHPASSKFHAIQLHLYFGGMRVFLATALSYLKHVLALFLPFNFFPSQLCRSFASCIDPLIFTFWRVGSPSSIRRSPQ